jgi:hypothetical protein
MYKKMLCSLLITGITVGLLTGCGGSNDKKDVKATSGDKKVEQTVEKKTEAPKALTLQDKVKIEDVQKFGVKFQYQKQPGLGLSFKVINNTDKILSGVQLHITVKSQFGDELRKLNCDIDKDIPAHGYVIFNADKRGGWETNQFMNNEVKAAETPAEKLKFDFYVNKIVYKDGTIESAGK